MAGIVIPLMSLMMRLRFHHPEKLPKSGAFVLAPNHYSEIDPLVVGVASWRLGRAPRYLAKASLFDVPVVGWFLRKSGQIPVERHGKQGSRSVRAAEELVRKGRMVVVYPEGSLTRDPDLWPMRGKTGAVRVALEQGIPVIPMAHWGTQALMPRYGKKIHPFPRKIIDIAIGDPVDLDAFRGRPLDRENLEAATDVVMADIARLVGGLRGETPPAERWDPRAHDQKETGRFEG
ncbi:1-acyl-sn-glycerol-3-phosphate acyltransferase [Agromyces archimandritae]|uniref:1-acyl-sn-glycerol-3-phosphate acyltransferase n=2 Tax=Agromyces archimandritae TaxID=2781962 RepID=A0A975FQV9_9MICO|nr:lysophospholipid acyltransferase family protein [Agromyces archimandritae]QTX06342.1 1-acyl-sn-glycerol-3-phosphate acyltransferase [Agromyces archimandritae]